MAEFKYNNANNAIVNSIVSYSKLSSLISLRIKTFKLIGIYKKELGGGNKKSKRNFKHFPKRLSKI